MTLLEFEGKNNRAGKAANPGSCHEERGGEEEIKPCSMQWRLAGSRIGTRGGVLQRKNEKSQSAWESKLLLWADWEKRRKGKVYLKTEGLCSVDRGKHSLPEGEASPHYRFTATSSWMLPDFINYSFLSLT